MRKISLLSLFIVLLMLPAASAMSTLHTHIYPLTENMTMTPYPFPECGKALYLGQFPFRGVINETHYALLTGWVLVNCPGVDNASIEVEGIYTSNGTVEVYDWTRDRFVNVTAVAINISVKLGHQEYRPIELKTPNAVVKYSPYNSTHELITFSFKNLTLVPDPMYEDAYGTLDPRDYGWPVNVTIRLLIDKRTGDGYLLDNGTKKYVGVTPFWHPLLKEENFVKAILTNTRLLIEDIKANPWVVEQVLEKARMANNMTEASRVVHELAEDFTNRIFKTEFNYLGRETRMVIHFYNLSKCKMTFEGVNITPNRYYYLPTFIMPIPGPYLVHTKYLHYSPPSNISGIPTYNYTLLALREFLQTGNQSILEDFIWSVIHIEDGYVPGMIDQWGDSLVVMDSTLPLDINKTYIFVLPLPEEYARAFNSPYLLVLMGDGDAFEVEYDPSFFTPKDIIEGWGKLGACLSNLKVETLNWFLRVLSDQRVNGFNATAFEELYPFIKGRLEVCGFLDASGEDVSTTSSALTSSSSVMQIESSDSVTSSEGTRSLCGPAFVVGLIMVPLLRRWRRQG
ncbi:hypothetical protein X802_02140 [Thermococcus guaymasensis DSM 11113]|uniref:CGP-CTERM sorting domain-containing protein n=1 Tax=Thermococcus guaymasensis DSM 11113 TaxID=1432656 RepID=A0A0X1KN62_9EURY|nr:CGP-CTERM sorting domain-containing protein [Thermococcus guaymasensis]AJC72660.1 hypothetical protein X802_02140 [Thermococcus guaymasensis DSM 11113]